MEYKHPTLSHRTPPVFSHAGVLNTLQCVSSFFISFAAGENTLTPLNHFVIVNDEMSGRSLDCEFGTKINSAGG